MSETETEATPLAGSVWALRTGERVDRWADGMGPMGARCEHCRYVIVCADRSASWIHNGTGQVRCDPTAPANPERPSMLEQVQGLTGA